MQSLLARIDLALRHRLLAAVIVDAPIEVLDEAGAVACFGESFHTAVKLGNQVGDGWVRLVGRDGVELESSRTDVEGNSEEDAVDGRLGRGNAALPT